MTTCPCGGVYHAKPRGGLADPHLPRARIISSRGSGAIILPDARSSAWTWVATRAVVVLCAVTLLASGALAIPDAVMATEIGNQISSGRRSQAYFESVMLAQDAAIARIKGQTHQTHRALKQARRAVTQSKHALRDSRQGVGERSSRLAELEALHAGTPVELIPEDYADRLRSARQELAKAKSRRAQIGQRLRTAIRQRHARQYRLGALKRQRNAAISRRESAEGGLGAYIVELTRLAQLRAENLSDVRLTTTTGFTWPSVGRISQTYGCTGYPPQPATWLVRALPRWPGHRGRLRVARRPPRLTASSPTRAGTPGTRVAGRGSWWSAIRMAT